MLSTILLVVGCIIALIILVNAYRHIRSGEMTVDGQMVRYSIAEFAVYLLCALGFPDFIMNTLTFKKLDWVKTERIPQTLIMCAVTPGTIIACSYLNEIEEFDMRTILACVIAISVGCLAGSIFVGKINGETLKKILAVALMISAVFLVVRLFIQNGAPSMETGLNTTKLLIAVPFVFLFGFINMFGVPMKPSATVLFLLLGLSPIHTLTLMLILGCVSPIIGSLKAMKDKVYHERLAVCSTIFGTVGALIGIKLAIQIDPTVLCVMLIAIILFTVYTLLKKEKK